MVVSFGDMADVKAHNSLALRKGYLFRAAIMLRVEALSLASSSSIASNCFADFRRHCGVGEEDNISMSSRNLSRRRGKAAVGEAMKLIEVKAMHAV